MIKGSNKNMAKKWPQKLMCLILKAFPNKYYSIVKMSRPKLSEGIIENYTADVF